MSCNENWESIGDYVDGTLEKSGAAAFEAHLATCVECRSVVEDFRTLRAASRSLEPQSPPAHAWAKLARAIEAEPKRRSLGSWLTSALFAWQPIASAAMLALIVSGLSWVGGRLMPNAVPAGETARNETAPANGAVDAEVRLAEEQFTTAIASLQAVTRSETAGLDDDTADVIRQSVEAIDEAIGESRAALESEPTNQLAQESLFDALESKVALLQETVTLINDMRQDAQEGAAGNGPGLNQ